MPEIMKDIMNVITAINGTENNGLNDRGVNMNFITISFAAS